MIFIKHEQIVMIFKRRNQQTWTEKKEKRRRIRDDGDNLYADDVPFR